MRMLPGILAGQSSRQFELVGDESLSARPMERVAVPLRRIGAAVRTTDGHAPLAVDGAELRTRSTTSSPCRPRGSSPPSSS